MRYLSAGDNLGGIFGGLCGESAAGVAGVGLFRPAVFDNGAGVFGIFSAVVFAVFPRAAAIQSYKRKGIRINKKPPFKREAFCFQWVRQYIIIAC